MKNIAYIIIFVLLIIVGYEAYQIEQLKNRLKKDEPKVTINIDKANDTKQLQTNVNPQMVSTLHNNVDPNSKKIDTNKSLEDFKNTIQADFQKLFQDVFGNEEVKKQLSQSIEEFQKNLTQAMQEFQKQMKDFDSNEIFGKLFEGLNPQSFKVFEDKGDYYEFVTKLEDKNAKVDINVKSGYIFINIKSHIEKKMDNQIIKQESQQNYIVKLPKDAKVETLKSTYKDKKLYITIQKEKGIQSI